MTNDRAEPAGGQIRHEPGRGGTGRGAGGRPGGVFEVGTLAGVAAEAGLDPGRAQQALGDGSYGDAFRADEDVAGALGVPVVPVYAVDGEYGISGAQPAEAFTQALHQVWAR